MEPVLIEPQVFEDDRGFFFESFNQGRFEELVGAPVGFVQDNHSRSAKGVLRGLHYQLPPAEQGKLVRVSRGAVYDVAVDICARMQLGRGDVLYDLGCGRGKMVFAARLATGCHAIGDVLNSASRSS